jgi:hypothetical protein
MLEFENKYIYIYVLTLVLLHADYKSHARNLQPLANMLDTST